ncbi:MAG: sigma-54-dependent Fis family transcriptional regulator [Gemmatimonadetes bacterium]|nr:sigma-54-dependent Fis family transcriptional regulator [Gemmatimonadota bacterium]
MTMRVLLVDDDPGLRQSLSLLLAGDGYAVTAEGSPSRALERAGAEPFDLILCDVRMPEMEGTEFLRRYQAVGGSALVVMMSAYGGDDAAIAAIKQGAYDYLPKPFRADEVLLTLRKAAERERLKTQVARLQAELARTTDREVVAVSPAMRRLVELASRVAPHPTTVLITGESGVGKEVVARAIHRMSPRSAGPFVAVNCAAIPEQLLESELFGHMRGAFTGATADRIGLFEEANAGTLLLDEIGDLPPALQVKLLRVLQDSEIRRVGETRSRRVDVRVIAATARDLEADVSGGRFREDLFYRLNVVRLHVPPLRERPEDVDALSTVLLRRAMDRAGQAVTLTPEARQAIRRRTWRGNVRELENAIERAVVLSQDGVLRAEAFEEPGSEAGLVSPVRGLPNDASLGPPRPLKEAVSEAERGAIMAALANCGGRRAEAARLLGVSQRTLFYKLKELGIV